MCHYHGGKAPQVQRKAAERLEATRERVLSELCRLAYVDPRDLFEQYTFTPAPAKEGDKPQPITSIRLRPITELEADTARAIKSVHFHEATGEIASIRLIDKKAALDSIAKSLGMFREVTELVGADGKPIQHTVKVVFVKSPHATREPEGPRAPSRSKFARPGARPGTSKQLSNE